MKRFDEIIEFIRKLYNNKGFIPLHTPVFNGNEKIYINDCIDTTYVSSVGKYVDQFEESIAKYTNTKYAVAVVNGTAALHISLLLTGVKPTEEVITQPLTFISTANAIKYVNASPVFIDVSLKTLGLCPEKLLDFLNKETYQKNGNTYNKTTNKIIRVCIPVHTFGHPCKIDEIVDICYRHNIKVIEDAAESLGSFYKRRHTGIFGDMGIISFNGNKIITTGGGGVIITNNEFLAKQAKHLTTQAKVPHQWEYIHDNIGFNYRMPNINAAIGLAQMEKIEQIITKKREIAQKYDAFFKKLSIEFLKEPENSKSNYWLNTILFNDINDRNQFLEFSNDHGVMTRPVWKLINNLTMYKQCQTGDLSNSKWLEERIINIPSSIK